MRDPGASEVLIFGSTVRPASTAFASRPAASSTLGFDVFVHDVIAAIRMSPFFTSTPLLVVLRAEVFRLLREAVFRDRLREQVGERRLDVADLDAVLRALRPASDGATVVRSSVTTFV